MPYDSSHGRYVDITILSAQVSGDLTNAVLALYWDGSTGSLPSEMFDADGSYPAKSDGSDLRATNVAGSVEYPIQIERFSTNNDPANGYGEVYVKVAFVSSSTDTVVRIWYNDPDATGYANTDTYGRNNVWSDYVIVSHLNEASGAIVNSTGNTNGTNNGCDAKSSGGLLGGGYYEWIASNNDYMEYANDSAWDVGNTFTVTVFMRNFQVCDENKRIFSRKDDWEDTNGWETCFYVNVGNRVETRGGGTTNYQTATLDVDFATSTWHQLAVVFNGTNCAVYTDGTNDDSGTIEAAADNDHPIGLGVNPTNRDEPLYDGDMDEFRIHKDALDQHRLLWEYMSMADSLTLTDTGSPASPVASAGKYGLNRLIMRRAFGAA